MKEIILEVLEEIACGNTGSCQINLQSKSAQEMIASKLEVALRSHVLMLMEDMACPPSEDRCCNGDCDV